MVYIMKRSAFTMLEVVFVIVVIAILAVLAMPNFNRNLLQEAAEQVAGHIRYTQHLAMNDDKYDPDDTRFHSIAGYNPSYNHLWFREYWRLRLYTNNSNIWYSVFTDKDREGNIDINTHVEPAIDPLTGKFLYGVESSSNPQNNIKMNLTSTFGITGVSSTCDANQIDIFFDNLGRPYSGSISTGTLPPYSGLLHNDCNITLTAGTRNAVITIRPETGYVSVVQVDP